ncbi:MAG: hypothetical protein NTW85_02990 [Methylococcales bacterium]|nr:hypothetical protein [Methylococcales bacterium]
MGKSSYEDGKKQAEKDIRTDDVSKSLQKDSILDGSLGASRDFKDGYRHALEEAKHDNKK